MSTPSARLPWFVVSWWQDIRARWGGLRPYWQHFFIAVILGIAIESAIHAAHDVSVVKRVQNAVLDTSLRIFSLREKADTPSDPLPVLLAIDDAAAQSSEWGADRGLTLAQALRLASHAFDKGAQHVLLDITFDADLNAQTPQDQAALAAFLQRYQAAPAAASRHLYVARSAVVDPCFPRLEALESLRTSVWDGVPAQSSGLLIHPVLPHYRADADHVVRGWDLFGVLRNQPPAASDASAAPAGWRFLPSPQLAYQVVKSTPADQWSQLPWLQAPNPADAAPSRAAFAAAQVQRLPLLADPSFSQRLCAHHPNTLGCPPPAAAPERVALSPLETLQEVNQLLHPLPQEHACRARATQLQSNNPEALAPTQPHDLLFNRIVFNQPFWERAPELGQRGYYLRTPLGLQNEDPLVWSGRLVAIGAAHVGSGDWHPTPIGHIPGVLINLNAMQSLDSIGPVSSPPGWLSLLINGLIIVAVAAVFSALSPLAAAALSAALLIGSLALFHQYLLSRGIWIEFGAPLIGINLHRIIDGYLEKRRLQTQVNQQSLALAQLERTASPAAAKSALKIAHKRPTKSTRKPKGGA